MDGAQNAGSADAHRLLFPLVSEYGVIPYLALTYHATAEVIAQSNLWIMSLMVFLLVVLPLRFGKSREKKQVVTNLSGENLGSDNAYRGAGGRVVPVTLRNWYLESWFGEDRMKLLGYLMELSLSLGGAFHV